MKSGVVAEAKAADKRAADAKAAIGKAANGEAPAEKAANGEAAVQNAASRETVVEKAAGRESTGREAAGRESAGRETTDGKAAGEPVEKAPQKKGPEKKGQALNRAAALVIPVAEATLRPIAEPIVVPREPSADQPGAVQPGRPVAPRPVLREFTEVPDVAGEVTCPNCAARNPADRAFCRRCGQSLRAGPSVARARRRFRLRWPRGRGRLRRLLAVLLALLLLALMVWAGVQYGPRLVDAVRDRTATPKPVTPTAVTASSAARGHAAELVGDGLNNRYWAPAAGKGKGAWVELTFGEPIRVLSVIVHGGVSPQQQKYAADGRPAGVLLSMWTRDGVLTEKRLQLVDRAGPQTFEMAVGGVARMRLTVESGYGLTGDRVPAIGEIEVFKRP